VPSCKSRASEPAPLRTLDPLFFSGYTPGMKTAVSIPNEVFEKVERLARRSRKTRSHVYSAALKEYLARHTPDEVTEAMNRVCDELGSQSDSFVADAGRRVMESSEW
jgi:predicted transcriptional regulator